jgi:hypothetical protein
MKNIKGMKNNKYIEKLDKLSVIFFILLLLILVGCQGNIEAKKADDCMALFKAVENDDYDRAKKLLDRGVSPDPYIFDDEKVLSGEMILTDNMYLSGIKGAPIFVAAEHGNLEMVKLLLSHEAKPDWCCCDCLTALHFAVIGEHKEIVQVLLAYGANTQLPYGSANTVLELAENIGNAEIIQMIREHDAIRMDGQSLTDD